MVRLARTVLHVAEDGRPLTYAEGVGYGNMLDTTAADVAEFRGVVSSVMTAIPTH
jgi:hypothetical protein